MKNIIFCGFGKLGKDSLDLLIKNDFIVSLILTHKENEADSVDTFAKKHNLNYHYGDVRKNLNENIAIITDMKPDLLISVNYRYIIPKEIYSIPKNSINIHGSLLPKYRGRTPHVWSIIHGQKESGVTVHHINKEVDTGEIIVQRRILIDDDDTGFTLLKKYEQEYPHILLEALNRIKEGVKTTKQSEKDASYYGKRTPEMGYIDFRKHAKDVINFVRAQAEPYPGAYYYLLDGRKIVINKVSIFRSSFLDLEIGVIKYIDGGYYVRCNDEYLKIQDYNIIAN